MDRKRNSRTVQTKSPEEIISGLLESGSSRARLVRTSDIVVDERVRLKCQVPLCDSYGKNLMCPPHLPSVAEFRTGLKKFRRGILLQVSAPLTSGADPFAPASKLHELVNLGEKWAFESGFRFALGLIGGSCRLCKRCVAANSGKSCRHPFRARPSMEAMGIDVLATAKRVRMPLSFPASNSVTWTGLILLD